jgi:hypothetical protein
MFSSLHKLGYEVVLGGIGDANLDKVAGGDCLIV